MPDLSELSLEGTVVDGRFEILSEIGRGAMGRVFRASQRGLHREVALKLLSNALDEDSKPRFIRESEILSKLSHQNVATFFTFGLWQETYPYFAMELLGGEPLKLVIQRRGRLDWQSAFAIGIQICSGLNAAHSLGIVHRDLTPRNVIVEETGSKVLAKLIDFGLATAPVSDQQNLTQTGFLIGTPHYMSPEVCVGKEADIRSDLYSLGCVLYECLTGVVPFDADTVYGIAYKHVNDSPVPPSNYGLLPAGVEDVVLRALSKEPEARFPTAIEFADAMRTLLSDADSKPLTSAPRVQAERKAQRLMLLDIVAVLAVCAVFAMSVQYFYSQSSSRDVVVDSDEQLLSLSPAQFERVFLDKLKSGEWSGSAGLLLTKFEERHKAKSDRLLRRRLGNMWLFLSTHSESHKLEGASKALPYLEEFEKSLRGPDVEPSTLRAVRSDIAVAHMQLFLALPRRESLDEGRKYTSLAGRVGTLGENSTCHMEFIQRLLAAGLVDEAAKEFLSAMSYREYPAPSAGGIFLNLHKKLKPGSPVLLKVQDGLLGYLDSPNLNAILIQYPAHKSSINEALTAIEANPQGNAKLAERAKRLKESLKL